MPIEAKARVLSAHPSLDHIRKEAKQVLAGLRTRANSAQLADAQLMVARSYGFSSWRALKEEVERRRGTFRPPTPQIGAFPTRPAARIHWVPYAGRAEQTFAPLSILSLLAMNLIPFAEPLAQFASKLLH